ncbi:hypothetical protein BVC93_25025 [Mycobacterium sp. MS1601]|nr:hypothetical protein BVC93_25025 [Mycobacterium sp. MS1601]
MARTTDRTRVIARVLGPYLIVVTLAAVARSQQMPALMSDLTTSSALLWVTGAFVLLIGLTVIAAHTSWRGAPAAIVSAIGWLTVVKGALLVTFPQVSVSITETLMGRNGWWQASMLVTAAVGVYLTYIGWVPRGAGLPASEAKTAPRDLPRAA